MLAAADFDIRFTYMLAGWEGSVHDASILSDSLLRTGGLQISEGKFYLGDVEYACQPGICTSLRENKVAPQRVYSKESTSECERVVQSET
jgi:hypothetical protein